MRTKVVWLAPYPILSLEPEVRLTRRPSSEHPCSWIVALSDALAQRTDLELHLVTENTRAGFNQTVQKGQITFHVVNTGVPFLNRGFPPWLPLNVLTRFKWNIARLLKEIHSIKPDIVHAHGTEAAYALTAVRSSIPCLISIQGIVTEYFRTDPCLRFRIVRHYEQDAVRHSRYFTCRTNFDTGFIRATNPNARIFTIHEAMNPVYFRNEWHLEDVDRLLYVGSLEPRKGLDILLQALKLVIQTRPNTILSVVGGGDQSPYRQLAEQLRVSHAVEFLGYRAAAEIARLHLQSQLFVLPSANENSPNTLAEAMVSGLPVLATSVGGIPSMVEHGQTGWLVPPHDPPALASAILQLLQDRNLRARLSSAACRCARERHLPERVAAQTVGAYREILRLEAASRS
ncbi:MAG TPA: glycosyltransferase family 4 protein [Verrucomicrobiae bacterium]|nr:glycosyltransferase family 4 protein [Verrucomicrobiae bacterium]